VGQLDRVPDCFRDETEKGMSLSRDVIEWLMMPNGIMPRPAGLNGGTRYVHARVGDGEGAGGGSI
jgi:hypothetical protein